MTRVLFICSRNRFRSPTAEEVFASWPGVETDSAGLAYDADTPLDAAQVERAELIFVMERRHKAKLSRTFGRHAKGKKIVCLDIADEYGYRDPELIAVLKKKVGRFLRG